MIARLPPATECTNRMPESHCGQFVKRGFFLSPGAAAGDGDGPVVGWVEIASEIPIG